VPGPAGALDMDERAERTRWQERRRNSRCSLFCSGGGCVVLERARMCFWAIAWDTLGGNAEVNAALRKY
jgi:hypothetical protein